MKFRVECIQWYGGSVSFRIWSTEETLDGSLVELNAGVLVMGFENWLAFVTGLQGRYPLEVSVSHDLPVLQGLLARELPNGSTR